MVKNRKGIYKFMIWMNVSTNCLTVDYISQQREYMTDCGQFFFYQDSNCLQSGKQK